MAASKHYVIIGNGIAGTTAARHLRKLEAESRITMISGEARHPFSRTALMYLYMGHMEPKDIKLYEDHFYPKNRIDLVYGKVERVDFSKKQVSFTDLEGDRSLADLRYDTLILATGSLPNLFGWPGQDLPEVGTLVAWQDLEKLERLSPSIKNAVVVGGGLIGIELAEMLKSRGKEVTFLIREKSYWAQVLPKEESEMVNRHIEAHGIDLRLATELEAILDHGTGHVQAVRTKGGEEIACDFVGITTGVHPNISFQSDQELERDKGILVDDYLQTSLPDVFAIGDCAQLRKPQAGRRSLEAVWYVGKMMGEVVAHNAAGRKVAYRPGQWFNSAKFFDLEYQVYGALAVPIAPPLDSIYWEHPTQNKSLRVVYDSNKRQVKAFNLMGLRFRHEVCDRWLREQQSLEHVLAHLQEADFDPEFFEDHHKAVLAVYEQKFGTALEPQKRRRKKLFGII